MDPSAPCAAAATVPAMALNIAQDPLALPGLLGQSPLPSSGPQLDGSERPLMGQQVSRSPKLTPSSITPSGSSGPNPAPLTTCTVMGRFYCITSLSRQRSIYMRTQTVKKRRSRRKKRRTTK
ncbi:protein ripply1 isoform X2 [Saccopteryx bilineata]|uniref:protein ripply1 isoform X2 n=1 Tax=Saccopteryx bilineata TaxID=59482 RepID=UPI00338FDD86